MVLILEDLLTLLTCKNGKYSFFAESNCMLSLEWLHHSENAKEPSRSDLIGVDIHTEDKMDLNFKMETGSLAHIVARPIQAPVKPSPFLNIHIMTLYFFYMT